MSRWNIGLLTGLLCVVFGIGGVSKAVAGATLPTVCVQAQRSYQSSKTYTRSTINLLSSFKRSWTHAFRVKARSKTLYASALSKYRLSTNKYNTTKSYLASKGFAISKSLSLAALLRNKGYKLTGNHWKKMLNKGFGAKGKPAQKPAAQKPPIDLKVVRQTRRVVKSSKQILTRSLRLSQSALQLLKAAKSLGLRAKSQAATAKTKLATTLNLIRRCRAELRKSKYRHLKKYTSLPSSGSSRSCRGDDAAQGERVHRVFCVPCDPMRSSCANTCFIGFGQMEQSTQQQQGQLSASESSSCRGSSGNVFFEIDMKTTEATNETNGASGGVNDTSGQVSSLSFR